MGKAARWFRAILGVKKADSPSQSAAGVSDAKPAKEKKRWGFVRSFKNRDRSVGPQVNGDERKGSYREGSSCSYVDGVDQNKHAIAVAAATAAVAEAAVAAAQAAAAVVRLTNSGRCSAAYVSGSVGRREVWAAVKIQAAFRGYLARRALRALKGLVKLQALVRGHIVRKGLAEKLRCLQAMVRVQARARGDRAHTSESLHPNNKHPRSNHPGPATPEKYEHPIRASSTIHDRVSTLKRNGSKQIGRDAINMDKMQLGLNWSDHGMDDCRESPMKTGRTDDEKSDKILEVDTGKPHLNSRRKNSVFKSSRHALASDRNSHSFTTLDSPSRDSTTAQLSASSPSSGEVQSLRRPNFQDEVDDPVFCTANNSPQFFSATSRPGSARRSPFTPTKSECSRSFLIGYSDHPNYMANTESSRAKVRSQSAPKQRPEFEKSSSTKRLSVHGFGDKASGLQANFTGKAYPGSGRLDRLGMPIRGDTISSNGVHRNRY